MDGDPILHTLRWLRSIDAVALPCTPGQKFTWVRGWPTVAPNDDQYGEWFGGSGRPVDIAARTGRELGWVDVDQATEVQHVLRLFPAGCPIMSTRRGWGVGFRPAQPIGNGKLLGVLGEFFTSPHLVLLPPSRDKEWITAPVVGDPLPVVDIVEMGLAAPGTARQYRNPRVCGGYGGARGDRSGEIAELVGLLGEPVIAGRYLMFRCPFHANGREANPSFAVNGGRLLPVLRGGLRRLVLDRQAAARGRAPEASPAIVHAPHRPHTPSWVKASTCSSNCPPSYATNRHVGPHDDHDVGSRMPGSGVDRRTPPQ